jgi:hypothetical protein
VRRMMKDQFTGDEITIVLSLIIKAKQHAKKYNIDMSKLVIDTSEHIPTELVEKLRECYKKYKTPALDWREILYEIYYVSLSSTVVRGNRWGVLYDTITHENLIERFDMYEKIYNLYVQPREYRAASYGMRVELEEHKSDYDNSIKGEIDLIVDDSIVDIKCYNSDALTMANIIQLMCYYEMYNITNNIDVVGSNEKETRGDEKENEEDKIREEEEEEKRIKYLEIFNPLKGIIYRTKVKAELSADAREILRILLRCRDETIKKYITEDENPLLKDISDLTLSEKKEE